MAEHKFPYKWYLKDGYPAKGITKNRCNVFGTFICGGGSTMGYKLSGFNHLGGVEIDKEVAAVYQENHKPKYLYNEDIRLFNERNDLPPELYSLDILDGSPPCSTFSMAGSREKAWGKSKQFREGQAVQTLDDLVFVYCDTIIKLQPKVFLLENVKGIIQGNAKVYSKQIVEKMTKAGYMVQVFCLNAASMGVPQKRERVFFIGHKKEFNFSKLRLNFDERAVTFGEATEDFKNDERKPLTDFYKNIWQKTPQGKKLSDYHPTGAMFSNAKIFPSDICPTLTSTAGECNHYSRADVPGYTTDNEWKVCGTYPLDYNFKTLGAKYLIGMSVPPVMTAQIAHQIWLQWLSKINI